jgi:hypothetical protein
MKNLKENQNEKFNEYVFNFGYGFLNIIIHFYF